jgi:hypothetical protein
MNDNEKIAAIDAILSSMKNNSDQIEAIRDIIWS